MNNFDVIIIGAGPAGLAAGYVLAKDKRLSVCVLEADSTLGGIAKTIEKEGMYFDLGGHRFFTKSNIVNDLWNEVINGDFLVRNRLSRIYYNGKFFSYPLKPFEALIKLGLVESFRIGFSFLRSRLFPQVESSFEGWVSNRFGKRLFEIFFKSYTEKVWGIECSKISLEWAAQRIKGLSLSRAVIQSFFRQKNRYTSLIEQFNYPEYGPGMMWDNMKRKIEEHGGKVFLNNKATGIIDINQDHIFLKVNNGKDTLEFDCRYLISSMALRDFFDILPSSSVSELYKDISNLRYRSLMTVILILNKPNIFPDNWIYIHSNDVKAGRIQNFNNWSPYLVPDKNITCLGMEYFVSEGDELWSTSDKEIIRLASEEIDKLGIAKKSLAVKGYVYRTPKAYPMYISEYKRAIELAKDFTRKHLNIQFIGRNGQHRYNNMDHSMLTGIYAARNLLGEHFDVWSVNIDDEYHESRNNNK